MKEFSFLLFLLFVFFGDGTRRLQIKEERERDEESGQPLTSKGREGEAGRESEWKGKNLLGNLRYLGEKGRPSTVRRFVPRIQSPGLKKKKILLFLFG